MRIFSLNLVLILSAFALSCATPASTLQTGKTPPRGKLEMNSGIGLNLASGFFSGAYDAGLVSAEKIDSGTADLSDEETRDLVSAAFSGVIFAPAPIWQVGLRYGILDRWDVGLAYATSGILVDSRFQILDEERGGPFDMAIGVQYLRKTVNVPVPGILKDVLDIEDIKRNDVDVSLISSRQINKYFLFYGGPKFIYTFMQADILEKISAATDSTITTSENMWSAGGVLGMGLGYEYAYVMLEANVLYYKYEPKILDVDTNLSGVNVYPAVGLHVRFY
jgi:hypothetical protein